MEDSDSTGIDNLSNLTKALEEIEGREGGVKDPAQANEVREGLIAAMCVCAHDGGCIHANYLSPGINEWASGIARIERRIRLNDLFHHPSGGGPHAAAQRTHNASGHRELEAKRIPHGDGQLAYLQTLRIAERSGRREHMIRAQYGDIGVRIVADTHRIGRRAVKKG